MFGVIKQLKQYLSLKQPNITSRIIGIILIIIGLGFFIGYSFNPTLLYLKIGFASIIIGAFVILILSEQSFPKKTSDAKIEGNIDAVKKFIGEFQLDGNAIFLTKSDNLSEERVFIPPNKTGIIKISTIDNNHVFMTGSDGRNLGILIPPSGLKLLNEIEKYEDFKNADMRNIEEKLQKFVGMNLLKSISFKREESGWRLELERPIFCPNDEKLCRQYPCPTCSAVLTAIARASNSIDKKLWINNTTNNGTKIRFYINFISKRKKQEG